MAAEALKQRQRCPEHGGQTPWILRAPTRMVTNEAAKEIILESASP